MSAQVVRFDAFRSVAFGSITASYVQVGTPIGHQDRLLKFVNNTNADIRVSFDGTTDNDFIPANSFALYDFQTDAQADYKFTISVGTGISVKYDSAAPTGGSFYIIGIYGQGE